MLDHFPRPPQDNGRGVHWSHSQYQWGQDNWSFWRDQIQAMHLKWVKLLDDGSGSALGLVKRLIDLEVMPVVRFYREEPNPSTITQREVDTVKRMVGLGAVYFETNNEPDLALEWSGRRRPQNWLEIVVNNFIKEADLIREAGGFLLFPAFGPGGRGNPFRLIVERGRRDLLDGNCGLAIHNYCLGRPLDYPNDAVNTRGVPLTPEEWTDRGGLWAWEMDYPAVNAYRRQLAKPHASIMEDSTCFRAFEYFDALVNEAVGHSIPIFTTEGGYNVGQRAGNTTGDDPRYPKPTPVWHGRLMDDMFKYIEEQAPAYYFACMPWLIAVRRLGVFGEGFENQGPWFTHQFDQQFGLNGQLPIVDCLKARAGRVRVKGRPSLGLGRFYAGPDLSGRDFDDRFKYLEPQVLLAPVSQPDQPHWKLIRARWADKKEARGKPYIYVQALDEHGRPLEGAKFQADRGNAVDKAQTKGLIDQYLGNILMTGLLGTYTVSMAEGGLPSDRLTRVGLGDEVSPREFVQTSFFLTFQKTGVAAEPRPLPPPPEPRPQPVPPPGPEVPGRQFDPRLAQLEPPVQLVAVPAPDRGHWQLVEARWATEKEAQGRGYVFVKALDEQGRPLEGATFQADRGNAVDKAQTKGPIDQYLGNIMLTGRLGSYTVSMAEGGLPSDKLANVGLGQPGVPWARTAFYLTFQRLLPAERRPTPPPIAEQPTPQPQPRPPESSPSLPEHPAEAIEQAPDLASALAAAAGFYAIPFEPQSALFRYAESRGLGGPRSAEFPLQYRQIDYQVQVFEGGIVYQRADQPQLVSHIPYQATTASAMGGARVGGGWQQFIRWLVKRAG